MNAFYRLDANDDDSTVSHYDDYVNALSLPSSNTQSQSIRSQATPPTRPLRSQGRPPTRSRPALPPLPSRQRIQDWQQIQERHWLQQQQRRQEQQRLQQEQHDQGQFENDNNNYSVQGSIYSDSTNKYVEASPKTSWLTPKKVYFAVCLLYLISIGTMGGVIGLYWQMHSQVYNGTNNGGGSGVCGFQGNIMNPVPSIIYVIVILGILAGLLYLWRDACYGKMFNGSKYEGYACVRFNSAFYMGMNMMLVLAIMCTDAMSWKAVSSEDNGQWAKTARILLATGSISGILFALLHPICCLCFKGARDRFYT